MADAFEGLLTAILELQHLTDLSVHHDGQRAAVTVEPSFTLPDQSLASRIWLCQVNGRSRQLTFGPGADGLPRWSPIDNRLAFASDRDHRGRMSLFVLDDPDAEPRALGSISGFVEEIAWSPDARFLLVLAADPGADAAAVNSALKLKESDPDPDVRRPGQAWRRLFRVDVESGSTTEVGPDRINVWEFDLVDANQALAIVSPDPSERAWYRAHLASLDLANRTQREIYRPVWQIQAPTGSPSLRWAALTEGWASDRALVAGALKAVEIESGRVVDLSAGTGDVTWASWRDDDSLWFAGWVGQGSVNGVVRLDGAVESRNHDSGIVGPNAFYSSMEAARDRAVWALWESDRYPQEVVRRLPTERHWTSVSAFNTRVLTDRTIYPKIEEINWDGANSLAIQGLLMRPADGEATRLPMIVGVHGGPTWAWKHAFDPGFALPLVGAGYAVLLPNYRGSTGRGQAFTQLNIGDPGGKEFQDILRGVQWAVTEGIADPDRIGIMGASYGGYMTAWAAATSEAFSAAVMISGISNLISCHHTCNNSSFYELITQRSPYNRDHLDFYLDRSPVTNVAQTATPTLILHGAEDLCTPVGQAQEFYQALVELGVSTELVTYPREGHGFRERDHQIDAWHRIREWFDRYLRAP